MPSSPLPSARSAYGWLETTAPQIVSNEFDAGGMLVGRTAKLGVHGTSAIDTTFRFAGLDATSALRPGTPMVLPDVVGMSSIDVTRMASDISANAPGPVVEWQPLDGRQRVGMIEGFYMPKRFAVKASPTGAQPSSQLQTFTDGSLLLGGAVAPGRASAVLSAHWAKAQRIEKTAIDGTELSLVGALTFTPSADERLQLILNSQSTTRGALDDRYGAAQFSWQRGANDRRSYRAAGGYQWMNVAQTPGATLTIDSALDGSVFPALFQPAGKERALKFSGDLTQPFTAFGLTHHAKIGGAAERSTMTPDLAAATTVLELVNLKPARVWRVDASATASSWTSSSASAFANDRIGTDTIWLEGGVRIDHLQADNGGATRISWTNLYAHAAAEVFDKKTGVGVFGSYTRAGARLPAMALAWGDVNAPTARVYRWFDTNQNGIADGTEANGVSSLITRVGPGAAGGLTKISPDLQRPVYDIAVAGLRVEKTRFAVGVSAVIRRTGNSIRAVDDAGTYYTTVTQPDQNADFTDASDDQQLTAYNRKPESFGLGTYTLTNPANPGENSIYAFDLTAQYRGTGARLAFSAAAVAAKGTAASRGFRADENDPMVIGDAFSNPNATTNAVGGRTYFDRGYVGKIIGAFDLPSHFTLGIVARYQDGQPFSRLAIFENLNQGPEAVVGYPNGRPTRFTFISTTDVRLQKTSAFGSKQLTLIVDGFNVFNIGREVSEYVIGDANFRKTTLIEPPRTIRVGVRIAF
ncbi:MAG: hypothetical protein EPO35_05150 [Acidobacteria bacterium]|nr:MAG: hypothetical protein EPO35_05150 [Acidobacteriota bacterium]